MLKIEFLSCWHQSIFNGCVAAHSEREHDQLNDKLSFLLSISLSSAKSKCRKARFCGKNTIIKMICLMFQFVGVCLILFAFPIYFLLSVCESIPVCCIYRAHFLQIGKCQSQSSGSNYVNDDTFQWFCVYIFFLFCFQRTKHTMSTVTVISAYRVSVLIASELVLISLPSIQMTCSVFIECMLLSYVHLHRVHTLVSFVQCNKQWRQ